MKEKSIAVKIKSLQKRLKRYEDTKAFCREIAQDTHVLTALIRELSYILYYLTDGENND